MPQIPPRMLPTLSRFAGSLGLSLNVRPDGSASFVFERSGTLSFTPAADGERVVMNLTRKGPGAVEVLARGGYEPSLDRVIHTGMTKSGAATLAIVFEQDRFEVSDVTVGFAHLAKSLGA